MCVAIATVAAISAGTTIYAAHQASSAAHDAADIQSASADKALAAQQQGYAQQRQDFQPYQQAGTAAVARMGQTAGTYTGGQPPSTPPPPLASLGNPTGLSPSPQMTPPPPQGPPQGLGMQGTLAPQGQAGGALRKVKAPTGEIALLSDTQAQLAVAKGATIIG